MTDVSTLDEMCLDESNQELPKVLVMLWTFAFKLLGGKPSCETNRTSLYTASQSKRETNCITA
jgi:hypothetical protein